MTINNEAHIQYVRPEEVRALHLDAQGKVRPQVDLKDDILAYDAQLMHRPH